MKELKVGYTLGDKCVLNFQIEGIGDKTMTWPSDEDVHSESVRIAEGVSFEVIYQAGNAPYIVLGVHVPHDTVVQVDGEFQHDGGFVAALANGEEYGEPFVSETIAAGDRLSCSVTA